MLSLSKTTVALILRSQQTQLRWIPHFNRRFGFQREFFIRQTYLICMEFYEILQSGTFRTHRHHYRHHHHRRRNRIHVEAL